MEKCEFSGKTDKDKRFLVKYFTTHLIDGYLLGRLYFGCDFLRAEVAV
jgi:hypothetical protein